MHIDYHVEVDGHYYSVPYQLVMKQLEVRLTAHTVECFHANQRVASHLRSTHRVCDLRQVQPVAEQVYARLEHDDVLAMAFGRLLLWTDAYPLPAVGEVEKAFQLYLRTWRPGAYSRGTAAQKASLRKKWGLNYAKAMDAVE